MKHAILLLSILLCLAILTFWLASYAIPAERTFITAHNTYHLVNHQGTFRLSTFSNTPEDDSYTSLSLSYWLLFILTALPAISLIFFIWKKHRRTRHGFPL